MFETSESTEKLDEALAKVQGELDAAAKDKTNPHFKSRYADLTSVWEACRPALAKHGVSVTQWPVDSNDGRVHVVTRVAFKGQWIRAKFSVPVTKSDAQGYGSATTYCRRYSLSAALGIVADEDDDGNAASRPAAPRPSPPKNFAPQPKPATPALPTTSPPPKSDIDPLDQALGNTPIGDYVFQASSLKGRKISEVPTTSLSNFVDWYNAEQAKGQGFKPHPHVAEAYHKVVEYLSEGKK